MVKSNQNTDSSIICRAACGTGITSARGTRCGLASVYVRGYGDVYFLRVRACGSTTRANNRGKPLRRQGHSRQIRTYWYCYNYYCCCSIYLVHELRGESSVVKKSSSLRGHEEVLRQLFLVVLTGTKLDFYTREKSRMHIARGVLFCCALVPGTLVLDLPTLIL